MMNDKHPQEQEGLLCCIFSCHFAYQLICDLP